MKKFLILLFIICFKPAFSQTDLDYLLFIKINDYRVENGLSSWQWDHFIWTVAQKHTQYQSKSGYMGHREDIDIKNHNEVTGLLDRFKEKKVYEHYVCNKSIVVAENVLVVLAKNKSIVELAELMLQMWIDSPPHHGTLLHPDYKYGSISCLKGNHWNGAQGNWIYVTLNVLDYE
jgi:uncharacterized protein YkwD